MSDSPSCPGVPDDLLERYLVGDLPPAVAATVEEKLGKDPTLRQRLAELRALRTEFLMADPPAQFAHRVVAKVELERCPAERPERHWGRWLFPLSSAVALGAVVVFLTVPPEQDPFGGLRQAAEEGRFGTPSETAPRRDTVRGEEAGAVVLEKESSPLRARRVAAPVPGPAGRAKKKLVEARSVLPPEERPAPGDSGPVGGVSAGSVEVRPAPGHSRPVEREGGSTPESFLRLKTSRRPLPGEGAPPLVSPAPMRVLSAPMRHLSVSPEGGEGKREAPGAAGGGAVADAFFRPVQKRAPNGGVAVWVVLPRKAYLMVVRVEGSRVIGSAPRESVAGRVGSNSIPIPAELASGITGGGALFLVTGERAFSAAEITLTSGGLKLRQGWLRTERVAGPRNLDSQGTDKQPLK